MNSSLLRVGSLALRFMLAIAMFWIIGRSSGILIEDTGPAYRIAQGIWPAAMLLLACFIGAETIYIVWRAIWRRIKAYAAREFLGRPAAIERESYATDVWQAINENIIPILLGVTLLLGRSVFEDNELVSDFLRDLGIAFVVAFVLVVTIERRSKIEQVARLQAYMQISRQHLFRSIFGVDIPPKMYDLVQEKLLTEYFYRFNVEVNYDIKEHQETSLTKFGACLAILDVNFSYEVRNIRQKPATYHLKFFTDDNSLGIGSPNISHPEVRINDTLLSEAELSLADMRVPNQAGIRRYRHEILMEPETSVRIQVKSRMIKLIADSEIWRSIYPCDKLNFSINHPPTLRLFVDSMHPYDLVIIHQSDVAFRGSIPEPLFPGNGFVFWWFPHEEASARRVEKPADLT